MLFINKHICCPIVKFFSYQFNFGRFYYIENRQAIVELSCITRTENGQDKNKSSNNLFLHLQLSVMNYSIGWPFPPVCIY